jgi:CheY-like chemotaxis protein
MIKKRAGVISKRSRAMKKRILVVDDNQAILDVVKLALEMAGYEVSTSLTGACFKHIDCNLPDLILLDILLSGEDGGEICQRLKSDEQTRHIPVILLSAHTSLRETAKRCGADSFLVKPFRIAELREIVSKYLEQTSPTLT